MENYIDIFKRLYVPVKAIVISKSESRERDEVFVESYDFSKELRPINPSQITTKEAARLVHLLNHAMNGNAGLMANKQVFPENILYMQPEIDGYIVWYTKPSQERLYFVESLKIPSGMVNLPALVWKASATSLEIYAVRDSARPTSDTVLYKAPFFNVDGFNHVCMGDVDLTFKGSNVNEFIFHWQRLYFGSVFTHTLDVEALAKTNIVQLWQQLVGTNKRFPTSQLLPTKKTLGSIL